MRHTAAFRYQFPVTAYVTPLVFQNPPAPADIQEKILATDGEVPDYMGHRTKRILRIERKEYQTY